MDSTLKRRLAVAQQIAEKLGGDHIFINGEPQSADVTGAMNHAILNAAARGYQAAEDRITALEKALEPFAACCEYIRDDEDDEEWAKFRLLIKDYRAAHKALKGDGD